MLTVIDGATGASRCDARVTITGSDTGALVRQVASNGTGLAQSPLLNPGIYDIKVEKEGFRTVIRSRVDLRVTEVLALRVWGELTFAEIATALDQSINTVTSRHRYALEALRRELKPYSHERR